MLINRTEAPAFTDNFIFPAIDPQVIKLQNGMMLYVIDAGSQDLCKLELVANAGSFYEPALLVASATNALMREGTTSKTSVEIAETLDYYGAFLEMSSFKDNASMVLYSLNKHLSNTLPICLDVFQNPIFPEKELSLYKTNQLQKFKVNSQKVDYIARLHFNQMIFGNNAYGQLMSEKDYENLSQKQLIDFYKKHYLNKGTYAVLSGRISSEVLALVTEKLGQLILTESDNIIAYKAETIGRKEIVIDKADALQSAIRIGRPLVNKTHPDYFGLKILDTILGGYFGSRLMNNIREDKGYTYGINSGVASLKHDGFFYISTEVGVEVCQLALNEIYKEINILQNELVSNEELQLVKNYLLGTFLRSLDGPFALSEKFTAIKDYELTNEYYLNYVKAIKQADPKTMQLLAQKYLKKEDLMELVVGKK